MEYCNALLSFENKGPKKREIKQGSFDYNLKNKEIKICLEILVGLTSGLYHSMVDLIISDI